MEYVFDTKDIFLTAFLLTNGYKIQTTELRNRECFFIFKDDPTLKKIIIDYYGGHTSVEPTQYINKLRKIKRIMYNEIDKQGS